MPKIIKDNQIIVDNWKRFTLADGESPEETALPDLEKTLMPLSVWLARKAEILARHEPGTLGVWLESSEGPEALSDDLAAFAVIAVDFPKSTDGRGYSTARLLRERYGYRGEIRAIGDVLRDQLYFMKRCGINAFAVRENQDIAAALAGLRDFSESYQAATDQPQPLFRRRTA